MLVSIDYVAKNDTTPESSEIPHDSNDIYVTEQYIDVVRDEHSCESSVAESPEITENRQFNNIPLDDGLPFCMTFDGKVYDGIFWDKVKEKKSGGILYVFEYHVGKIFIRIIFRSQLGMDEKKILNILVEFHM